MNTPTPSAHSGEGKPSDRKRRVFVDMDGVVVDFDAYKTAHGLTGDEVKAQVGAYLGMQPIPGAIEAVRSVIGMGYEVWMATKPPTGVPHAYSDKAAWVMQHLPELKRRIIVTHDKGLLGNERDFLLDDRPHKANCEQFRGTLLRFVDGYHWPDALRDLRDARELDRKHEQSEPLFTASMYRTAEAAEKARAAWHEQSVPDMVTEALEYFWRSSNAGERKYVEAIRAHIATLSAPPLSEPVDDRLTVAELAELLGRTGRDVLKALQSHGVLATLSQRVDFKHALLAASWREPPSEQAGISDEQRDAIAVAIQSRNRHADLPTVRFWVDQALREAQSAFPRGVGSGERPRVTSAMVQRFLGWRLPDTFAPDCYISFDKEGLKRMGNGLHWPVGTNLFTDPEARAMLEYVLDEPAQETQDSNLRMQYEALKDALHDEIAANLAFREAGGALPDEDMPTFCARLLSELSSHRLAAKQRREARPAAWQFLGTTSMGDPWPAAAWKECLDPAEARKSGYEVRPLYAHPAPEAQAEKPVGYLILWNDPAYRGKASVSENPCHKDDGESFPLYLHPQPSFSEKPSASETPSAEAKAEGETVCDDCDGTGDMFGGFACEQCKGTGLVRPQPSMSEKPSAADAKYAEAGVRARMIDAAISKYLELEPDWLEVADVNDSTRAFVGELLDAAIEEQRKLRTIAAQRKGE